MKLQHIITIDPGHPSFFANGTVNWGAVSTDGIREVEVTLEIAIMLRDNLDKNIYQVFLTRSDNNQVISNEERIKRAADNHSQFILRLHCDYDGNNDTSKHGVRTFFPPEKAKHIYEKSKSAAMIIHEEMIKHTELFDAGIHDDTVANINPEVGMLVGSKEADTYGIPTVLVEMVYLSNKADADWVIDVNNKKRIVQGLSMSIERVFKTL